MKQILITNLRLFLLFVCLLFNISTYNALGATVNLQTSIKNGVKNYLENHFLNATFIFADKNKILSIGARGIFDQYGTQLKANQKMAIASGTKSITAAGILRLYDQGKLDIHDPISKYFDHHSPIWVKSMPAWANKVTIHHLLTHSSGIAEYYKHLTINTNMYMDGIIRSIINFAAAKPLAFNPGKQYQYCNTNFIILGMIIEKITGLQLADFFEDEFFKPLGMNSSHLATLKDSFVIQQNNSNYPLYPIRYIATPTGGKPKIDLAKFEYMFVPYADGGILSNTGDMITWYRALHHGSILSAKSYKMMTTKYFLVPDKLNRKTYTGYGIFISELATHGYTMIHHSVSKNSISDGGFIPERDFYFTILSNISTAPEDKLDNNINLDQAENQLGITYFREVILKIIEGSR